MKKYLLLLGLLIVGVGLNAQSYIIDVSSSDTSLEYKIDNSRPFLVQVESFGIPDSIDDGQLYIYNKSIGGAWWNLVNSSSIPLTIENNKSYTIVNTKPSTSYWLFVYKKNSSDTGSISINIESLKEITTGGSDFSSKGGRLKNYPSNRLFSNKVIDITSSINITSTLSSVDTTTSIREKIYEITWFDTLDFSNVSGTDTVLFKNVSNYRIIDWSYQGNYTSVDSTDATIDLGGTNFVGAYDSFVNDSLPYVISETKTDTINGTAIYTFSVTSDLLPYNYFAQKLTKNNESGIYIWYFKAWGIKRE